MGLILPEGILTFLFSDIQGSTPLWEKDPEGMHEALSLHNAALHAAIEANDGRVFKIVGDEFQVVFVEPLQAIKAAIAAQRALAGAAWGRVGPLLVRMGIHTGHAQVEGADYAVAHTFNRAARIMSAGHGGQILLSQETAVLIRSQLPHEIKLRDMGRHKLKGLRQNEHIFQINAPDLQSEFPALKTLDIKRHNLPAQVTPFIGREREIKEIEALISPHPTNGRDVRLLTLTGPGGTGKTRLALETAARMLPEFEDGVFFVDLAAVRDPAFVLPAIERVLAIRKNQDQTSAQALTDFLAHKKLLLVLDNFEQVLPAANDAAELLSAVSGIKILVTSRALLRIYGEVGFDVGSLQLPNLRESSVPEQLAQVESVQLFSEHARAVQSKFTINGRNAGAVAEICRRLDGLPLAIELAAARIRMLSLQQMLTQLENRFRILSGGARNLPPRQRTLLGAIDWSYDLLSEEEQALFRRLGIFVRGCTFESATAVCDFTDDVDIFGGLEALIDHSLLSRRDNNGEARFVMLQTIRDYAIRKLNSSGELQEAGRRHLAFYTRFAEDAQQFMESADESAWLDRLEQDYDNFSAALQLAIDQHDAGRGVRIAQALRLFWFSRGYLLEGRRHLTGLLSLPIEAAEKAALLDIAGFLARYYGDYAAAEAYISEGLAIARQLENKHAIADSLANAGFVYLQQDRLDQARDVYTEALSIYHELANDQGTAENLYLESLQGAQAIGFQLVIAAALEGLAGIAAIQEAPQRALQLAGAAAELRKQANIPASAARVKLVEQTLAPAWQMLGEEAGELAWRGGQALDLEDAVNAGFFMSSFE